MAFDLTKNTEVIFRGRKAVLTGYFDAACLLFDKHDPRPEWEDLAITDDYYDGKYFLFFTNIPCNERTHIKYPDGSALFEHCYCASFLIGEDLPKNLCDQGYIDIIGDDPLDYRMTDEGYIYNRPDVYAHTQCKKCGKRYKVHIHDGYRLSYPKWELE